MKSFFAAVQFLTIVPVPATWSGKAEDLQKSITFFPVVGVFIGLVVATLDAGLSRLLPLHLSSLLVVAAMVGLSGGLHIDGLADTADGLFSSRSREEILEIMKDSRVGPMGVVAIVFVVGAKVLAITSLPATVRWGVILLVPVAGRTAMVLVMTTLPYVRREGGLATAFEDCHVWPHAAWALVVFALAGWMSAAWQGLAAWAASVGVSLAAAAYVYRKIDGFTGDVLGAACELVEVVPALAVLAWPN